MKNVSKYTFRLVVPQSWWFKFRSCKYIWNHLTVELSYVHNAGTKGNTIHLELNRIVVEEHERPAHVKE